LTDADEFVVDKAVYCFAALCGMDLIAKPKMFEICNKTAPLLLHPNGWLRFGNEI